METELVGLGGVAGAGVVLAIVAMIRQTLPIPDRFTSALAVLVGIAFNVALRESSGVAEVVEGVAEPEYMATILTGVMAGLAASGLWSTGKTIRNSANPPAPPAI